MERVQGGIRRDGLVQKWKAHVLEDSWKRQQLVLVFQVQMGGIHQLLTWFGQNTKLLH